MTRCRDFPFEILLSSLFIVAVCVLCLNVIVDQDRIWTSQTTSQLELVSRHYILLAKKGLPAYHRKVLRDQLSVLVKGPVRLDAQQSFFRVIQVIEGPPVK